MFSFSQEKKDVTIDWSENTKITYDSFVFNTPQFQLDNFYLDLANKSIYYNLKFPVSSLVDENSLVISNLVYESIIESDLKDLSKNEIPNKPNATIKNSIARDLNFVFLSISPIVKTNEGFKKIKSFSFSYSTETKARPNNTTARDFNTISNSVLSDGSWYRFYVEKSGVYKVSKTFLEQLGMNTSVDPRKIKIFGNGGRMIPLLNSVEYPSDLAENAIYFKGEQDGVFNSEDYILFYAEGVDNWSQENLTNINLYENKSYYYVTSQGSDGKRIQEMIQPSNNPSVVYSTFDDYQFHEVDLYNPGRIGRKWLGNAFNIQDKQSFEFKFPNLVTTVPVAINIAGAATSNTPTNFSVKANSTVVGNINFAAIGGLFAPAYTEGILNQTFTGTENTSIELTYNDNGVPSSIGYLDYIKVKAKRNLKGYNKQFRFQVDDANATMGIGEFQFTTSNSILQVWDITDIYNVNKVENDNQSAFSFKANLGEVRKYIAVDKDEYFSPRKESQTNVVNQNIKGTIFNNAQGQFEDIDYLIITPDFLKNEAERLANFHRNYSQLNVKVVILEKIYQEFSSGKQDIGAIRNLVKYVYFNASTSDKRVKYLNLFGDASFDYKNRIANNNNIVPTFETIESNSLFSNYMSDDYFGMMDNNEGNMSGNNTSLDVAVGRMIIDNLSQATEMVTKVIDYHDVQSYGRWRNNFVLISDDVDQNWEGSIQQGIDDLGDLISSQKPNVNVIKFHADSYLQETSAGGNRYPKLNADIIDAFEQGSLVFNYFGHGGEDGLAQERIFGKTEAQNLNNRYKYPLFITVTCEFTRFDNPLRPTAGEYTYWNPLGGAVSMITTTRPIGVSTGQNINVFIANNIFGFDNSSDISIAEALRRSKNSYNSPTLMVFYIGDPALKLAIPNPKVVLTKVNNVPIEASTFVFNALSTVTLSGEVRDEQGNNLLNNYNGDIAIQIFDKNLNRNTLANDNTYNNNTLIILNFDELGETIFRGNATVTNGLFEFTFVVPRDIRIPIGSGRISFYAKSPTPELQDQSGHDVSIQIGGINETAPLDNIGPTVRLYMNDESFISGGITNDSPIFLAFLEDEHGINTASGIGHDIVAVLDGDENNPYILNDYYETELDNFQKGKVKFPFRNLAPGLHTITFKAWDVYNNPIMAEIQFIVVGDDTVALTNVLNYPNPFVSYTQFWFTHNKPFEPLDVQVQILTITGKIVKTINQVVTTEGFLSREITWDGKDDFGDKIGKGVYVYKLTVKSNITNKKTEKYEKLVIL